ncbi:hypothetical protein KC19_8G048100 [Ceratodon purpureus]|uniref:acylphosphatase n=1 Tax=Ceratodon purpureus TaxID=3225 RepID=A0A8T0GZV4_CERPU|nr:hypothetical protein KC19_8G048100 [Ceratodon purpureus]
MSSAAGVAGRSLVSCWGGSREGVTVPQFARVIVPNFDSRGRVQLRRFTRGRVLTASMSDGAQSVPASGSGSKAVNVLIKGTVQGVFYRKWTVSTAQKLGLNGWVRNCRDGSVEAVFQGPSSAVDTMVQQCGSGPSAARVWSVDVSQWDNEVPQGFEQKPTW